MVGFGEKAEGLLNLLCSGNPEAIYLAETLAQAGKIPLRRLLAAAGFTELGFGTSQFFANKKAAHLRNIHVDAQVLERLRKLHFLDVLDFSNCQIDELPNARHWVNLRKLFLSGCQISKLSPPAAHLRDLSIYGDYPQNPEEEAINQGLIDYAMASPQLEQLTLYKVGGLDIKQLKNHKKLKIFMLSHCQQPVIALEPLLSLETLTLSNCGLEELQTNELIPLSGLQMNNNKLQQVDLSQFKTLSWLGLERNQLSRIDLSSCANLRFLNLSNNQLTGIDLNGLHQLNDIRLSGNKLERLVLKDLLQLRYLHLGDNPWVDIQLKNCQTPRLIEISKELEGTNLHRRLSKEFPKALQLV